MENPTGTEQKDKNTGMAVFAYFIFFLPLLTEVKDDPFVKYHVKQSLVFFISVMATALIGTLPFVGKHMSYLLSAGLVVIWILGIMNAVQGKEESLPLIGKYAEKLDI